MNNRIKYLALIIALGLFNACQDLSIAPENILTEEQVFESESAVEAYMASLYDALPMEDHLMYVGGNHLANRTDESISCIADERNGIGDGTWMPWWGYDHVRNVNDLIEKLPNSTLGETKKQQILGEAYFIRAYYYFAMAKRYGGVPIIKKVQNFNGENLPELQIPRDNEAAVYDFIASDLDSAAVLLEETNDKGRATSGAALALKSRAMLYAASIARYGSVQLNGIVGIPSSEADKYWEAAFDAAEDIISSGNYSLYNEIQGDKAENFRQLFLDEGGNPEVILARHYSYPDKSHGYDNWYIPFGIRGPDGYSSRLGPTLELVEQFEYIDGTSGELKIEDDSGDPIYYDHPTELFENKDPRLLATVVVPYSELKGSVIDIRAGLYDQGVKHEAGDYSALYNPQTHEPDNENGTIHIVGLNGIGGIAKTQTGFYIRKYLDTSLPQSQATTSGSDQQWIDLRYGEVLLNYAEAAVELDRTAEAKSAVNEIRQRAGIRPLEDNEITIERVRHERLVELAFENHRWWDYRRWRTADNVMNNTTFSSLRPYYVLDADAYRFEVDETGQYPKTFQPRIYYERIDPGEIAKNPELVQNPNY